MINQVVYEKQIAELELLRLLAEADEDVKKNNLFDAKSVFDDIKKQLKKE